NDLERSPADGHLEDEAGGWRVVSRPPPVPVAEAMSLKEYEHRIDSREVVRLGAAPEHAAGCVAARLVEVHHSVVHHEEQMGPILLGLPSLDLDTRPDGAGSLRDRGQDPTQAQEAPLWA